MEANKPHHTLLLEETLEELAILRRRIEVEEALERVRGRAMAMHHSDQLREVVALSYEQLKPFGVATWGCEIDICDERAGHIGNGR